MMTAVMIRRALDTSRHWRSVSYVLKPDTNVSSLEVPVKGVVLLPRMWSVLDEQGYFVPSRCPPAVRTGDKFTPPPGDYPQ
jgi:hypothetical protein